MPKDSLTQRYEVVCEIEGEPHKSTLEITVDNNGRVKDTKVLDNTKMMDWDIQYMPDSDFCPEGYERRCVRVVKWLPDGTHISYLICFCIKFNY